MQRKEEVPEPIQAKEQETGPAGMEEKSGEQDPIQAKEAPLQLKEEEAVQAKEDTVQLKESMLPSQEINIQEKPAAPSLLPPVQRKEEESEPVQLQEDETIQAKEEDQVQVKESVSPAEESIVQEKPVLAPVTMPPLQRKEEESEPVQLQEDETIQAKEEDQVQMKESVSPAEESIVQEKPVLAPVIMPPLQRKEEEDEPVQAKGLAEDRIQAKEEEVQAMESAGNVTSDTGPSVEQQLYNSKGGGSPLSEGVKTEMETGFGTDFSDVRVHTGSAAVGMSNELGAQAFTHQSDIYFNEGKFSPESNDGKFLLAHELAHTVQQGGGVGKEIQKKDDIDYAITHKARHGKFAAIKLDGNGDGYNELDIIVWVEKGNLYLQVHNLETKQYSDIRSFTYTIPYTKPGIKLLDPHFLSKPNDKGARFINNLGIFDLNNPKKASEMYGIKVFADGAYRKNGTYYVQFGDQLQSFVFDKSKIANHDDEFQGKEIETTTTSKPQVEFIVGAFGDKVLLQYEPNYDKSIFKSDKGAEYVSEDARLNDKVQLSLYMFEASGGLIVSTRPVPLFNLLPYEQSRFDLVSTDNLMAQLTIGYGGPTDVFVHYIIQPVGGENQNPAINRDIMLIFTGTAVLGGLQRRSFSVRNGKLTYDSKLIGEADYLSFSALSAPQQLEKMDYSGGPIMDISQARGIQNALRTQLVDKKIIRRSTFDAWNQYVLAFMQLRIIMKSPEDVNSLEGLSIIKSTAEKADIYFNLIKEETSNNLKEGRTPGVGCIPSMVYMYNPYTNPNGGESGAGRLPGESILAHKWTWVTNDFKRLKEGYDSWILFKAEGQEDNEIKTAGKSFERWAMLEKGLTNLENDQKEGHIKHLQKIKAVFYGETPEHINEFNKKGISAVTMPLPLWAYVKDNNWVLVDFINPDRPYYSEPYPFNESLWSKDENGRYIPPIEAFMGEAGLQNELHLPKGKLYLDLKGKVYTLECEGDVTGFWDIIGYIGLGLAAVGLGLVTFGTGTIAVLGTGALVLSSVASIASTAGSMYEESKHGQLTNTRFLLGALEIFTSLVQLKLMAVGKVITSGSNVAQSQISKTLFTAATKLYVPLKVAEYTGEGLQIIVMTVDAASQIQTIMNAPGDKSEKERAIAMLVGQLTVSGAFFVMDLKGSKEEMGMVAKGQANLNITESGSKRYVKVGQATDIDIDMDHDWIPPVAGVDQYEHTILRWQLGDDKLEELDLWLKKRNDSEALIDQYGTEGVYHALNLSDGDFSKTKKLLKESGGDYAEMREISKQKEQISDVEDGTTSISGYGEKKGNHTRKGNYGEMKMDDYFENLAQINGRESNLRRISKDRITDIDTPITKGIDGVYENLTPPPKYIIAESKFGESELSQKPKDGPQMSDDWILGSRRLDDAVGKTKAREIINDGYDRVLFKVDIDGKTSTFKLNSEGKEIGPWP